MKPTQAQMIKCECGRTHKVEPWPKDTAAEVGDHIFELDAKAAQIAKAHIQDTIERCAQVAETQHLSATKYADNPYEDIAAAIRALKK
jgi:hypothetical protein